jgi:hypothetical protein
MKENTNEIKIESNTDNQKLENLIEKNNNILLDQKRKRIILDSTINDIDVEMKKSPLSTMNINHSKLNFFPNITETIEKKMSIDLNENQNNNLNNNNKNEIGCNCKNSFCLKRYCECFTRMKYCNSNCQCKNCFNTILHEKERNEAIKNYIIKSPISFKKVNIDMNNLCCYCKKSNCLKKYCECYQIGMKCSLNCKCLDCKNRNNFDKKLFEINYDNSLNKNRFYSFDDNDNVIKNNNYVKNFERKIIQLQNKVIIDNYDIKNDNNLNNNNIIINSNSAFSYNSNSSSKDVDKTTEDN